MCNIAGYIGSKDAAPILAKMMQRQEGFGGGYYDTYLEKFPNTKTMGICFDFQLIEDKNFELPTEPTDRQVDYILMPRGIYNVKEGIMI